MTEQKKIDGRTKHALDMAIAKRQVSQESYRAVLAGELSLADAKRLGRDGGPTPADAREGQERTAEASRSASTDGGAHTSPQDQRLCLCGCGEPVRGKKAKFRPGHDHRLYGELKRNLKNDPLLRNERFTDEQKAYAKERGLI